MSSEIIGYSFYDSMDAGRTVVPLRRDGTQLACKVFFGGVYAGTTSLPERLFTCHPDEQRRIGFVPMGRSVWS